MYFTCRLLNRHYLVIFDILFHCSGIYQEKVVYSFLESAIHGYFIKKNDACPLKPLAIFQFVWCAFQAVNMTNMEIYVLGGTMDQLLDFRNKQNVWSSSIHLIKSMMSLWVFNISHWMLHSFLCTMLMLHKFVIADSCDKCDKKIWTVFIFLFVCWVKINPACISYWSPLMKKKMYQLHWGFFMRLWVFFHNVKMIINALKRCIPFISFSKIFYYK